MQFGRYVFDPAKEKEKKNGARKKENSSAGYTVIKKFRSWFVASFFAFYSQKKENKKQKTTIL